MTTPKTDLILEPLYKALDYRIHDTQRLMCALTHASHHEGHTLNTYERLEFLGDRVLGLIVAQMLFEQFPREEEGSLAKRHAVLVSREILLKVADVLDIASYLRTSEGVVRSQRSRFLQADVCEALIAVVYLEGGLEKAEHVVRRLWQPHVTLMQDVPQNPKSCLQEWAQEHAGMLPVYTLVGKEGPDHAPSFTIQVQVGARSACARAPSKRDAEQCAASILLKEILS
jgi:ribonuclease III